MSSLEEGIIQQLGPAGMTQIARSLGADESVVNSAVKVALPAIIAGMANNTQQPAGAESLSNALSAHSGSIFGHISDLLASGGGDGAKILGHVLGGRQPQVEQNLAKQGGIPIDLIMKLLPILAPLVMGYLSKEKQSEGLDAGEIGGVLRRQRQADEQRQPGLGGLAAILDGDGDGSIVDDIIGGLTGR